jgi:hypothetical protein
LDAIAEVIAECYGTLRLHTFCHRLLECTDCELNNAKNGFSSPIHCILSDGLSFEFFKFERADKSRFLRGCFAGDPEPLRRGLELPDFTRGDHSSFHS